MDAEDKQVMLTLNRLVRLCQESEKGFLVAAENVRNRGLKTLLKSFAQQRADFARELQTVRQKPGNVPLGTSAWLASIHRGLITIRAAMTIGQQTTENVILSECGRGEAFTIKSYERALSSRLPAEIQTVVEKQLAEVRKVYRQVTEMRGKAGTRLVVRLFDRDEDAERAIRILQDAGFDQDKVQTVALAQEINVYERVGAIGMVGESAGAGALAGMAIGALVGLTVGIVMRLVPDMGMGLTSGLALFVITLMGGAGVGAILGAVFGALIGQATAEEDTFLYADSLAHGKTLVMLYADEKRAAEAAQIMWQVNAAAIQIAPAAMQTTQ